MTKGHAIGHAIFATLYVIQVAVSVVFFNSAGLWWLVYAGCITFAFGLILLLWASRARRRGGFVTSGPYALVRHPEFLGHILVIVSLILLAQHAMSLITGAVLITLLYFAMIEEERRNVEKFGDAYLEYMKRVPRVNLLKGLRKF
ncbi:methyltransferase family protein [Archaeoglobus fulgidus]|uniref:Isoprenylcysteine carboxylmethyltransferase family protein n=2 Tax=Archaeoglobus fulgidus TaxID=2234 RepID=O30283_ARCFU|nr:isoprenylcysteine carboxylmethyltransferase family protein [Archaeoglobus fulgidus]AAB91272.1 conserved hypothetical protein [Archaeoglobus fulgidus DSM 4304]KUJ94751.1 MAG: hypothetical protein XD40_0072 [Archaeoglobus fulgidus]KUK07190.1 MAG: hypothetical protein XD48_0552 [Archaeoglobus fulgidus]